MAEESVRILAVHRRERYEIRGKPARKVEAEYDLE